MLSHHDLQQVRYARLVTILMAFLVILWLAFKLPDPLNFLTDADQGHQLAGATQILFGEHPFIDWRSTYGPLTFYASVLGQILSGQRIIGEMILILLGYGLAYLILFRLLWLASGRLDIAVILTLLALILIPRMYKYYIVLGPVVSLWATWNYIEKPGLCALAILSLAVAITGLFRSDFGVYTALAGAIAIGLSSAPQFQVRLKRLVSFAALIIACASPWLLWAWFKGGLDNYFYDTIFGAPHIATGMALPFPSFQTNAPLFSLANRIFILFIFFYILPALATFIVILRHNHLTPDERLKLVTTIILAQTALIQSYRADYPHLLQAIPISFILSAWLVGQAIILFKSNSFKRQSFAGVGLSIFASLALISISLTTSMGMWPSLDPLIFSEKLRVYSSSRENFLNHIAQKEPENWYLQAMQYVRRCTHPSQRILALPLLTTFYYLTDRAFAGGQMGLAPGFFSTSEDQNIMIERISTEEIPLIIELPNVSFDGLESRKVEFFAPVIFNYLNKNFVEVGGFGPAVVKVRQDLVQTSILLDSSPIPCPGKAELASP